MKAYIGIYGERIGWVLKMDNLTQEQRHRNMQRIHSKDTGIEMVLRKKIWAKGYRYHKNDKSLPGKPDIAFPKYKLAVFCDSEFFHGKNWEEQRKRISKGNNSDYWILKIERNMERDRKVSEELQKQGWYVLRFWGKTIKQDPDKCVEIIEETIRNIYGPVRQQEETYYADK